jgi:sorbitol-specific phosphotransferase system component IIBC
MAQMTEPPSSLRDARRIGAVTLIVALAQILLVALALGRVLDPGSMTFEVIGILVGLGMATGALAVAFALPSRNPEMSRRIGS